MDGCSPFLPFFMFCLFVIVLYSFCAGSCHELIRTRQVICPLGHYCRDGRIYEMPPGRYSFTEGVIHPFGDGTGECEQGYFCPPASTSSKMYRCGMFCKIF